LSRDVPEVDIPLFTQAIMLLPLTLIITALLPRVVSENISFPLCRWKYEHHPEMEFLRLSCIRCYEHMLDFNFKPGMKATNISLFTDLTMVSNLPDGFLFYL
jgi:hypothetical protein